MESNEKKKIMITNYQNKMKKMMLNFQYLSKNQKIFLLIAKFQTM